MADTTTLEVMTNITPQSCVEVKCDCNTIWSLVQQLSYMRLTKPITPTKGKILEDYTVRARRIAATYARFYLETEDGGDMEKKGRFYWMALGAFASKTVACVLESPMVYAPILLNVPARRGLAKGNLWLFQDISAWHWYYSKYNGTFDMCLDSRNASEYHTMVKAQLRKLQWQDEALPTIKQMTVSKEIRQGFELVKVIEEMDRGNSKRPIKQLDHLLAIANHEQGVILQPLIYDGVIFSTGVVIQRQPGINIIFPELELVFSNACKTDNAKLKSVAPEGTKLEDFDSRMKWITAAADKFHRLMQYQTEYMEAELRTIAGWVDMPDPPSTMEMIRDRGGKALNKLSNFGL